MKPDTHEIIMKAVGDGMAAGRFDSKMQARCRCPGPGPCSECRKRAKAHTTVTGSLGLSAPSQTICNLCGALDNESCRRETALCGRDVKAKVARRVVGIQGKKGSGKSVIADYLLSQGFQRIKFATVLKDMLRVLFRRRGADPELIERMLEGDLKEVATPYLNGKTPRWAMQALGTEYGRECIHPDLWVDTERDALPAAGDFVCDDVRFPNEAAMIHSVGGMLILVERPDLSESGDQHASETHQLPFDVRCTNDGTIGQLQEKIGRLLAMGQAA